MLVLTRVSVTTCTATTAAPVQSPYGSGKGGFLYSYAAVVTITDCTIQGCVADQGGAISNELSRMDISGTNFTDCYANEDGGTFHVLSGTFTLASSFVTNSTSKGVGGCFEIDGIVNWESSVVVSDSTISGCTAGSQGVTIADPKPGLTVD